MPPPTTGDPWLVGRHFGIVIDAGSSGSRLQIYSWKDPQSITVEKGSPLASQLPKVEKGTQHDELWFSKVEPGISTFADDPESVGAYLRPLLNHAREHVPPSRQHETPLFLLATAGMRLLTPAEQAELLQETCRFLVQHSNFKIDGPSVVGPCGSSVRIITGEEEGLFGWIAINYLMDGFTGSRNNKTTYGFLDMGGASTQIAFEPSAEHQGDTKNLIDVRLRLLGGDEVSHKVFVTTWLGYGTNQARERYVGQTISEFEATDGQSNTIPDPCLPKGLVLTETPVYISTPANTHTDKRHKLMGTGSFEQCIGKTSSLLNKTAPCPDTPCLMNGVHVPPINFQVSHFIGVSEYWFSSEHIFGLGGAYDYVQYERAASAFCQRDWEGILKQHGESRLAHQLDGNIIGNAVWGPKVDLPRLQLQCFKAAWIANVLHEGIGMPRIIDLDGNLTTDGDKVTEEADKKSLGRPVFQSVDTVGDIAISWTLGKMVLEASKEIKPISKTAKPIVDPIDDIEDLDHSPIKPIRPLFSLDGIEDTITPHLPSSLTRTSLGFSPVLFLLVIAMFMLFALTYPLRRQLRSFCLRSVRNATKRDTYGFGLEEGKLTGNNDYTRHVNEPTRSSSMPNGFVVSGSSTQYIHSLSRASSPGPGFVDDASNNLSNSLARSHNSSQINLSSIAPRATALSRVNSVNYNGGKGLPQDE